MDNAAQFYIKGPLVAWMLDVEIRRKTDNARSLDDVMLALNRDARAGKTFADEDLMKLVQKYAGTDLSEFYDRYIHGTDTLPIEQYLSYVGLRAAAKRAGGSLTMSSDSAIVFESIDEGSSYAQAGFKAGDKIVAIDGTPLTLDNIELLANARNERKKAIIGIERNGVRSELPIDFGATGERDRVGPYELDPQATPLANRIRTSLLSKRG
jgi:predicted metalloprotease with PDZ domain